MPDDPTELPPANLILQALHSIRAGIAETNQRLERLEHRVDQTNERLERLEHRVDQTNERLERLENRVDQTNQRLDQTNQRIDTLREFTVAKLTELNSKVDNLAREQHLLNERFEGFLLGEGARLVARVTRLEQDVESLKSKVQP